MTPDDLNHGSLLDTRARSGRRTSLHGPIAAPTFRWTRRSATTPRAIFYPASRRRPASSGGSAFPPVAFSASPPFAALCCPLLHTAASVGKHPPIASHRVNREASSSKTPPPLWGKLEEHRRPRGESSENTAASVGKMSKRPANTAAPVGITVANIALFSAS